MTMQRCYKLVTGWLLLATGLSRKAERWLASDRGCDGVSTRSGGDNCFRPRSGDPLRSGRAPFGVLNRTKFQNAGDDWGGCPFTPVSREP